MVAEIETLGPGTTAEMTATLRSGSYTFRCYLSGQAVTSSEPLQVTGNASVRALAGAAGDHGGAGRAEQGLSGLRRPPVADLAGPR